MGCDRELFSYTRIRFPTQFPMISGVTNALSVMTVLAGVVMSTSMFGLVTTSTVEFASVIIRPAGAVASDHDVVRADHAPFVRGVP